MPEKIGRLGFGFRHGYPYFSRGVLPHDCVLLLGCSSLEHWQGFLPIEGAWQRNEARAAWIRGCGIRIL
jgi:hypothetical protein